MMVIPKVIPTKTQSELISVMETGLWTTVQFGMDPKKATRARCVTVHNGMDPKKASCSRRDTVSTLLLNYMDSDTEHLGKDTKKVMKKK